MGLMLALLLPIILAAAGLAIDGAGLYSRQQRLQAAADAAALAAARELSLANAHTTSIEERARRTAISNAGTKSIKVEVAFVDRSVVKVTLTAKAPLYLFSRAAPEVRATAQARVTNVNLCMLVTEPSKAPALSLKKKSQVTANDCSIYSNSKDKGGVTIEDDASIDASLFCSGGGINGKKGHFRREPLTDCPQLSDPLSGLQPPRISGCDFTKTVVNAGVQNLSPGVYCGGLSVTNGATANLTSGTYIIKDGKLKVDKAGSLIGRNVSFYLAGKDSNFEFAYDSVISLEAASSGPLAGILIFDDPVGKYEKHKIFSNDARMLLGTIYLPNGALYIDAQRPIADRSAYTVLITRTLELFDGPNLVLNSDYGRSLVPVPQGVGPGVQVSLVR